MPHDTRRLAEFHLLKPPIVFVSYDFFEGQTTQLLDAIHICRSRGLTIPALMLVYATIDGMAWCARRDPDGDVSPDDFTAWVDTYMLSGSALSDLRAVDVYAARCAMLHGQIAESRKSRLAVAKEIHYENADGSGLVPLHGLNAPRLPIGLDVDRLIEALDVGIQRFKRAIAGDADLKARVEASAAKYLLPVRFRPADLPSEQA